MLAGLDEGFESSLFEEEKAREDSPIPNTPTLFEHLMVQAKMAFSPDEISLAEKIIGSVDERGFFCHALADLFDEHELAFAREILEKIQMFDPPGIAAFDLKSSLLLQLKLKGKEKSLAYKIIELHFEDLVHNRLPALQKNLGCTQEALQRAIFREIGGLSLQPAARFNFTPVQPILPDLILEKEEESWQIKINEESLPSFRIAALFLNTVEQSENPEQNFFRRQIAAAKWLERIVERRKKILSEIGKFLIQRQPDFLSGESKLLNPMTLQELSEALCLHPSTVVRAVSHKYIFCRQGLLPLRSFFTAGKVETQGGEASSQQVKELLRSFVTEENKHAPLSDHALSRKMQRKGISVARRTVTKYRKALRIPSASIRRQFLPR